MAKRLEGKRVAFLAADGVEQVELTEPWKAVENEGGTPELISLEEGEIQALEHLDHGDKFQVDKTVSEAKPDDYDGLVQAGGGDVGDGRRGAGGYRNRDSRGADEDAWRFPRAFWAAGKPVAQICHGPWM